MNRTAAPKLFGTDGIRGTPGQEPLTLGSIRKIAAGYANLIKKIAHGLKE